MTWFTFWIGCAVGIVIGMLISAMFAVAKGGHDDYPPV